jgi:Fe-S oxidoreductase
MCYIMCTSCMACFKALTALSLQGALTRESRLKWTMKEIKKNDCPGTVRYIHEAEILNIPFIRFVTAELSSDEGQHRPNINFSIAPSLFPRAQPIAQDARRHVCSLLLPYIILDAHACG